MSSSLLPVRLQGNAVVAATTCEVFGVACATGLLQVHTSEATHPYATNAHTLTASLRHDCVLTLGAEPYLSVLTVASSAFNRPKSTY